VAVAFSPDGKTLAAHWSKGPLALFDAASGAELRALSNGGEYQQIAFSPDGKQLASAGDDGLVRLWEVPSGLPRRTVQAGAASLAFSPDGKLLASGSNNELRIWDAATFAEVRALPAGASWFRFTPDGSDVLCFKGGAGERHAATGQPIDRRRHDGQVWSVAASPDGIVTILRLAEPGKVFEPTVPPPQK
jgi:WD40 repeat protein